MSKEALFAVSPALLPDETRVYRQMAFGLRTFDAFQDVKRLLNDYWGDRLTNAEVLQVLILSHPVVNSQLYRERAWG